MRYSGAMERTSRLVYAAVAIALAVTAAAAFLLWRGNREEPVQSARPAAITVPSERPVPAEHLEIESGDTLTELLYRAGIEDTATAEVVAAVGEAFDVRKFRAGSRLTLTRAENGSVKRIEYVIDPDRKLSVLHSNGAFESSVIEIPGTVREVPLCGTLEGSLFESLEMIGERAELALQIAEIFAWDLDFHTDPQQGDEFCLVVEKKEYANGQPPSYGRILSARYNNSGDLYEAYLFPGENGNGSYFSKDGRSLKSAFLRSPIAFTARVSSRFSHRRFHPVLKRYRPHLGTDYAVPTGTPVQAVASGRVVFSGRSRGAGNQIRIRHASGYETYYLHLSRRLVRHGQRVEQGQRIGLVGSTGLATGPHLDFRIRRNGVFQDFEKLRAPRSSSLGASQRAAFSAIQRKYAAAMESASSSAVLARSSTLSGNIDP